MTSMQNNSLNTAKNPYEHLGKADPLLACLIVLTRLQHRAFSAEALTAGLPLVDGVLTPELFVRASARAGLSSCVVKRELDEISELVLPAVLLLKDNYACVVTGFSEDRKYVKVIVPEVVDGQKQIELTKLKEDYTGYVIFTSEQHRYDSRTPELKQRHARHWFWGTIAENWRIYRDVLLASLLINLFALVSPLFIMNVYDRVVPNNATETLWVLAIGVTIVFAFDFLMRALRGYFIDIAGKKADVTMSAILYEKVLGLKMSSRPASVGAFANNLREFESIRDFFTSATITTVIDMPFVVLFLLVIGLIGGPLVFVPLIGIPIIMLYGVIIQASLRRTIEETFRAASQKNASLIESLSSIETIKTLGAESTLQRKWEQVVGHIARLGVRSRLLSSSAVNIATFIQQIAMVGIVIYGVYQIQELSLTMGALIACVILTGRAMSPMAQLASLATRYHQATAALHSLDKVMALPTEREQDDPFISRPVLQGAVEFQNVSFSYPEQPNEALTNVSFRIREGERIAIIGKIGSGKTTIEKLILGLYEPTDGAVRIDGIDARQIDPADLRRNIGYVPQDIQLFYGSVRDNIVYGAPHIDDEKVLHVAEMSGVTDFVNRHPSGFDMQVGERGESLSGGQRQSIANARALLLDPPMLLLDEPSNSMDQTTEVNLKRNLTKHVDGKTLVLITHRASMLDLVDRLIVMDNGRIVADGPKSQVLDALKHGKLSMMPR